MVGSFAYALTFFIRKFVLVFSFATFWEENYVFFERHIFFWAFCTPTFTSGRIIQLETQSFSHVGTCSYLQNELGNKATTWELYLLLFCMQTFRKCFILSFGLFCFFSLFVAFCHDLAIHTIFDVSNCVSKTNEKTKAAAYANVIMWNVVMAANVAQETSVNDWIFLLNCNGWWLWIGTVRADLLFFDASVSSKAAMAFFLSLDGGWKQL